MKSCNVFAIRAGNADNGREMFAYMEEYFRNREEIVNGIHDAPKEAMKFIQSWEKILTEELFKGSTSRLVREEFKASTIMVGWDADQVPYAYHVDHSGYRGKSKSDCCSGFVGGSGRPHVVKYLNICMPNMKVQNSNELLQNVIRALLYATLFDASSGGYVRVFDVKETNVTKVYDRPVLGALVDHYDAFAGHLSNSLFFLFDQDHHEYTPDNNAKIHPMFRRQFKEEKYYSNVVVLLGTRFVVRLVHFENPIDKLYEKLQSKGNQLKRKNSQRIVPHEVEDLPLVEVKTKLGQSRILCGQPTWEFVKNLQERQHLL
ncbi:unnamed protein product [Prunus brigantina]